MKFTNDQIIRQMQTSGLVPLFTHDNPEEALLVVKAAYEAGVRVFEFTNRKANSFEVFKFLHARRREFPDLMLGIGTVMDADTTERYINAGADFIISPIVKVEMAPVCHKHGKLWIPGCATLTEIVTAKENGAVVMKVFPGSVLGPAFISAIMPVVPGLQLMITGGVEPKEENLRAWFGAGVMCVGMGSNLFQKKTLEEKNWPDLKKQIVSTLEMIRKVRA